MFFRTFPLVGLAVIVQLVGCGGEAKLKCDPNAEEVTVNGTASCRCNAGYAGDGRICASVAVTLQGARWELPCLSSGGSVCNAQPDPGFVLSTTLGGPAGAHYDVALRFRGVVEMKGYSGGTDDVSSSWYEGGTPSGTNWNIYALDVSSPAKTYYLNHGTDSQYYCIPIDFTKTVRMDAGASVTLRANSVDGQEITNRARDGGAPIVIPGIPPAPSAYDGQFVQVDVLSVQLAP